MEYSFFHFHRTKNCQLTFLRLCTGTQKQPVFSITWLKMTTLGAEETVANIAQIRESLRREKFYIDRFAKVYVREIFLSKLVGCP